MPSKKKVIAVRVDELTYKKIKVRCDEDNRSAGNLGEMLYKNYIKEHENKYGEIEVT